MPKKKSTQGVCILLKDPTLTSFLVSLDPRLILLVSLLSASSGQVIPDFRPETTADHSDDDGNPHVRLHKDSVLNVVGGSIGPIFDSVPTDDTTINHDSKNHECLEESVPGRHLEVQSENN